MRIQSVIFREGPRLPGKNSARDTFVTRDKDGQLGIEFNEKLRVIILTYPGDPVPVWVPMENVRDMKPEAPEPAKK